MPEELYADEVPFRAEPLFANGGKIFTMDMGLNLCSVQSGPENGLTQGEARAWAALLAAAPAMQEFLMTIAAGGGIYSQHAAALVVRSQPKPKGQPFKRTGPKVGTERRLNVQSKGLPPCSEVFPRTGP